MDEHVGHMDEHVSASQRVERHLYCWFGLTRAPAIALQATAAVLPFGVTC